MSVLKGACAESGATLVLVTHDPGVARGLRRTLGMRDGLIDFDSDAPAAGVPQQEAGVR